MVSLTGDGGSGCWSRSLVNELQKRVHSLKGLDRFRRGPAAGRFDGLDPLNLVFSCVDRTDMSIRFRKRRMYFSSQKAGGRVWSAFRKLAILPTVLLCAVSCAMHADLKPADSIPVQTSGLSLLRDDFHSTEQYIRSESARWEGRNHRMGGTGLPDVDCSGFVQAIYRNVFGIDLPRTTGEQMEKGIPVERHELRAGDLVFFNPPTYPRHVGIYLSNSEFVHVSKTNGVTISRIDLHYWGQHYRTARRVLPGS
jgi:lipoprotein Spr